MSDYQGWKNYETWCVELWIGNDEGTSGEIDWIVEGSKDVYELAESIKKYIEENTPLDDAGLYTDLLAAALGEVDWLEIAEHHIKEEEEEDDTD